MYSVSRYGALKPRALASCAAAALLCAPIAAHAGCSPNPTQDSSTTTCTGTEAGGLTVASNNAYVTITTGASVLSPGAGVAAINVTGGPPPSSSFFYGSYSYIYNNGTVNGGSQVGLNVTSPTPTAGVYYLGTDSQIINYAGATIEGSTGIVVNGTSSFFSSSSININNAGTISGSSGVAISAPSYATGYIQSINNQAGGQIGGIVAYVNQLTNAGVINGDSSSAFTSVSGAYYGGSAVVNLSGGNIQNSGSAATLTLVSSEDSVNNAGTITNSGAGPAISATNGGTVTNTGGVINGALVIGSAGSTSFSTVNNTGGVINGPVTFGGGTNLLIADYGTAANPIANITGAITTAGSTNTLQWNFTSSATLTAPVAIPTGFQTLDYGVGGGATLTFGNGSNQTSTVNLATLAGGGGFVNDGGITTTGPAIAASGGYTFYYPALTITNNGAITATLTGGYAISQGIYGLGAITNTGTITAIGGGGVSVDSGGSPVTNSGTITADGTAVYVFDGTITNSGVIHSNNGVGAYLYGNQGSPATNTGTIYGQTVGAQLLGYTLTNSGTISSPGLAVSVDPYGMLINAAGGVISGNIGAQLYGYTFNAEVENAGTINGNVNFGSSYDFYAPGNSIINQSGGIINGTVTNESGSVTNAGTINGGDAASIIFLGSAGYYGQNTNTLTLQTGSTLIGDVFGSTGGAFNALILQGTGTANNNFFNFNTLNMQGAGTWTLGGTYSVGATTVSSGTLVVTGALTSAFTINSGGTLQGSSSTLLAQGAVADNGTLVFDQASDGTFANAITGPGALVKQNTGALTLSGVSSVGSTGVTGGALIVTGALTSAFTTSAGGTLQGSTSTLLAQGAVIDNGTLVFDQGSDGTFANAIVGTGALVKQNTGALTLSGLSIVRSTTVTGGSLIVTGGLASAFTVDAGATLQGSSATLAGTILDNGITVFDQASDGTFSGAITGSGSLVKQNTGNLWLSGVSSVGSTTVANGALVVTGALTSAFTVNAGATLQGSSSSLLGTVVDNGTLVFDQAANGTYSNAITGSGVFAKDSAGTLTLGGTSSVAKTVVGGGALVVTGALTSAFTINAGGTLQGSTSTLLAQGTVVDNGTLVFDQASTGTFANAITGTGALIKQNAGTLVLNGVSSVGTSQVNGGVLEVGDANHATAALTSTVVVRSGGTLTGHGTVIGSVTNNGGVVSPGGSVGVLTIAGNYTQGPSGVLAITSSPTQMSRLVVNGTATLAGTLQLQVSQGIYRKGTAFNVVDAASVVGDFTSVIASNGIQMTPSVRGGVVEAVVAQGVAPLAPGATGSKLAIANAFVNYPVGVSDFDPVANAILGLPAGAAQNAAFDELGGEIYADLAAAGRDSARDFLGQLSEQLSQGAPAGGGAAAVWGRALGNFGSTKADGNAHGVSSSAGGLVLGLERRLGADTQLGAAFNYDHSQISLKGLSQSGDLDSEAVAVYGERRFGGLFVDAAVSYDVNDGRGSRSIDLPSVARAARGKFSGDTAGGELKLGYRLGAAGFRWEPSVAVLSSQVHQDGLTEQDAGGADLAVQSRSFDALESLAGVRVSRTFTVAGGDLALDGRLAWAHELKDVTPTVEQSFAAAAGTNFALTGAKLGTDTAVIGAGLTYQRSRNLSVYLRYDGAVSAQATHNAVSLGAHLAW